ncbi:MAG TPA: hydantoinase/oxoprolinase family protein [Anaerolineales bacterium]
MSYRSSIRAGIDIGGTFTDFVVFDPTTGQVTTFKLLSTPEDPAKAVLEGLNKITEGLNNETDLQILHGSTVATNALLERKGASTALVTTQGFRDVLKIGRQNRPSLYDFRIDPPDPLVPEQLCFEVNERVDHLGQVLVPLEAAEIEGLVARLAHHEIESVAVCLLFSFLHPEHEQAISQQLRARGLFVSSSSEILPQFREYERTSTTVINAYVSPILDGYLSRLELSAGNSHLRVMQSNGGVISLQEARRAGVRCILSGPAGGVVASRFVVESGLPNKEEGNPKVITFDMGGTSTDVSLIDGSPRVTTESIIGGHPIGIPTLDIHTIGAGGGSIASVDIGGALRVGPESAGADPGPACYGKGELSNARATVTDANLVLGRLDAQNFLGGRMSLDASRSMHVLSVLGKQLGLDPVQTALGVIEVANVHMERALRVISVERGYDPKAFILLSFGGAGGLHASNLAHRLGIPRVLVPPLASTFSAFGMLTADVVKDYTQTIMAPDDASLTQIALAFEPLVEQASLEMVKEGFSDQDISILKWVDVRYRGQSFELSVDFDVELRENFHRAHQQYYGYARMEAPLEFVNVRVRAIGKVEPPRQFTRPLSGRDPAHALMYEKMVAYSKGKITTPFYNWERLEPGNRIAGPAIIVRDDTTVLLNPSDNGIIDVYKNLMINCSAPQG